MFFLSVGMRRLWADHEMWRGPPVDKLLNGSFNKDWGEQEPILFYN